MADIFISYKREDFSKVQPVVNALRNLGFSVWWDQDIEPNAPWEATIERELLSSRIAIVFWSPLAITSKNVKAESRSAMDASKLVQVLIEPCQPPIFFREDQASDLSDWNGEITNHRLIRLLSAIKDLGGFQIELPSIENSVSGAPADPEKVDHRAASAFADRGRSHLEKDDFDSAIDDFEEAVRRDKSLEFDLTDPMVEALMQRGRNNLEDLDYEGAVDTFEKAIKWNSDVLNDHRGEIEEAYKLLGRENLEMGHFGDAVVIFERAIEHFPDAADELELDFFEAYKGQIRLHLEDSEFDSAVLVYVDAISNSFAMIKELKSELIDAMTEALDNY